MTNSSEFLNRMFSLEGQVALITGASSGIGAHIAGVFARAGADVVLAARRTDRITDLAAQIADETGRTAHAVAMDVTRTASVTKGFDEAIGAVGVPTIIANNAGIARVAWALEEAEDDFDAVMNTNLKGAWRVANTAARHLQDAGKPGSIINTASILGLGVAPMQTSYATSKAAVIQMTRSMALEFQRFGVRVNAICPGYFVTEINQDFLEGSAGEDMLKRTPAKRAGRLEELDTAFLMFASPRSTFTTGAALTVDAGHHSRLI